MTEFNPYQAPAAAVEDQALPGELVLADRGTRLGAAILDVVLSLGIIGIVSALMIPFLLSARRTGSSAITGGILVVVFLSTILGILILNLVWLHRHGQSIAKRLLKIRILRSSGERASLGRIVGLRIIVPSLAGSIPFLGGLFGLADACFIFREDYRCLHDHIADTIVVQATDAN